MLNRAVFVGLLCLSISAPVTDADAQCGGVPRNTGPAPASPTPATPSTPTPATPSTPTPATPSTPTPNTPTPTSGSPNTPRGRPTGGIPINFTRQATSREILSIDWDYPTRVVEKREVKKGTSAVPILRALPKQKAFLAVTGDDMRPLLVLRECNACKGSDFAFLNRKLDNEKTMLLARWFHCVKLPPSVMHPTHHLRNLFAGKKPPHLFICKPDGSAMQGFDGRQTQSDMQKAMTKMVKECYKKDPKPALRQMLKFMSEFDHYDTMEQNMLKQIKTELYAKGPKSQKLKKLNNKLAGIKAKKAKAMKNAKAVCDLKLKIAKAPAAEKSAVGGSK